MIAPLLVAVALASAPAAAPPSASPPPPGPAPVGEAAWYGMPAVVVDGASAGALALYEIGEHTGHQTLGATMLITGLGGLLFGAPINHVDNGHAGRAIGSVAMRVGAVAIGVTAFVATLEKNCIGETPRPCSGALLYSELFVPVGVAAILDDALLARGPARRAGPAASVAALAPWLEGRGARGLSLLGRF